MVVTRRLLIMGASAVAGCSTLPVRQTQQPTSGERPLGNKGNPESPVAIGDSDPMTDAARAQAAITQRAMDAIANAPQEPVTSLPASNDQDAAAAAAIAAQRPGSVQQAPGGATSNIGGIVIGGTHYRP